MKHSGMELEAMATIAKAAKIRSLEDFQAAVSAITLLCGTTYVPTCVSLVRMWFL